MSVTTAHELAEAMYAKGELSPQKQQRDIVVPAKAVPEPARAERALKTKHGFVPDPPTDRRPPIWSLKEAPIRNDGDLALFPDRMAAAEAFWRWLLETRYAAAERAMKGYAYITTNARTTSENVVLYRRLLAWVAWCDTALWLLTHWYAGDNALPKPVSLVMPFGGFTTDGGNPMRLVRELTGLTDELLLEEALNVWRADSLSAGGPLAYLHDAGLPVGPEDQT